MLHGLGQLSPEGLDCAEIVRVYEQQVKLSKTRSKAEHRRRAKRNAERFKAAYDECKSRQLPEHRIPEAAGGLPEMVSSLTATDVEQAITSASQPSSAPALDYAKTGMIVFGGAMLLGGMIWLLRPKGQTRA
jgi:hypothetical protein